MQIFERNESISSPPDQMNLQLEVVMVEHHRLEAEQLELEAEKDELELVNLQTLVELHKVDVVTVE